MAVDVLRRILIRANDDSAGPDTLFLFDEAIDAAERRGGRAAVERIRASLYGPHTSALILDHGVAAGRAMQEWLDRLSAILDAEAARE